MDATKKSNPWLVHVAKFRKENPSLSYKDVLKQAKTTYTKGSAISGGATKKGGKMFGEDGHGIQKVPVDHVTAELVKQV